MKAEELNNDNYVYVDGKRFQILEKDSDGLGARIKNAAEETWVEFWAMDKIRLNRNILYRMGFSSHFTSDPQEFNPSKCFKFGEIELFAPNSTLDDFYINDNGNMVRVESLHELQNRVSAITGKELEVNI